MDPATAVAAGTEAWKVGGIAAVLLLILVTGGYLMFRFFVGLVKDLSHRLDDVQGAQVRELSEVVKANTASNQSVTTACDGLRHTNDQILEALRLRPCLIETGQHPAVRPPLPIKTPLPQKYHNK